MPVRKTPALAGPVTFLTVYFSVLEAGKLIPDTVACRVAPPEP